MLLCSRCELTYPVSEPRWRCSCGGCLRLKHEGMFSCAAVAGRPATLWRYREALGIEREASVVTLGEGFTPLLPAEIGGREVLLKLDYLCPTGSFKDRAAP